MVRFETRDEPTGFYVKAFRKSPRPFAHYRFRSPENRAAWMKAEEEKDTAATVRRAARRVMLVTARQNLVNPFKVGEILFNSWGWEQTNIDWYEVVATGKKSVTLQRIHGQTVETGFMCGTTVPLPGRPVESEKPETKILQVTVNHDGSVYGPYIKARHGCFSKWDGKAERCSWYA